MFKIRSFSNKSISPIVAIAFLLITSVISIAGFQSWYSNYQGIIFSDVERKDATALSTDVETIIGGTLYLKNGAEDVLKKIKIINSAGQNICEFDFYNYANLSLDLSFDKIIGDQVIDSGPHMNNGTIFNGVNCNADGIVKKACLFDGIDDHIIITGVDVNTYNNSKTTVAFWMRWDSSKKSVMPVSMGQNIWITNANFGINTGNGDITGISNNEVKDDWKFVVFIFNSVDVNSSNSELYINGKKKNITTYGTTLNRYISSTFAIGSVRSGDNYFFKGMIDELKVYKRALNSVEIMNLYNSYMGENISEFDVSQCDLEEGHVYKIVLETNEKIIEESFVSRK